MRIYFSPCSLSIRLREKKKSPGKQGPTEQEQIQIGPAGRGGAGSAVVFRNILERILSYVSFTPDLPTSPANITRQPSPASNAEDASPHRE